MLIVMAIILMVSAVALPTIASLTVDRRLTGAASIVQAAIATARDKAANHVQAGFRLVPDPAWPLARLADGTIDPSSALAYARIVPLAHPPAYSEGVASVHTDGFPAAFTPLPNRLVLEEAYFEHDDPSAPSPARVNPTSWFWNVRVGEVVTFLGADYTVTGPLVVSLDQNPEGYVNVGPPGTISPLDRGDGPREFLYLCNRLDDNSNGQIDDGWNGMDDDLDGLVDEDDEWEVETWRFPLPGPTAKPTTGVATVARRPIAAPSGAVALPAGTVIDATAWTVTDLQTVAADGTADYADVRKRSQVVVNPYTGAVDVVFRSEGAAEFPTWYGRPASGVFGRSYIHLWISERSLIQSPVKASGAAQLVSVDRFTGRIVATEADAADPAAAFKTVEGGAR